jgi:hypothetical protein
MAVRMAKSHARRGGDPYAAGMIRGAPNILRLPLNGRFAGVLNSKRFQRGLMLIQPKTRCIRKFDIHEFVITDEMDAAPGCGVDRFFGVGFVEFNSGGVIAQGDRVEVGGVTVAEVAGFDETHAPNHLNIVLRTPAPRTGIELGIKPGDPVMIKPTWQEIN